MDAAWPMPARQDALRRWAIAAVAPPAQQALHDTALLPAPGLKFNVWPAAPAHKIAGTPAAMWKPAAGALRQRTATTQVHHCNKTTGKREQPATALP